jgi:hypothetical protein
MPVLQPNINNNVNEKNDKGEKKIIQRKINIKDWILMKFLKQMLNTKKNRANITMV